MLQHGWDGSPPAPNKQGLCDSEDMFCRMMAGHIFQLANEILNTKKPGLRIV
jgi:hypothetical protein